MSVILFAPALLTLLNTLPSCSRVVESRRGIHPEVVFTYVRVFKDTEKHRRKRKSTETGINRPVSKMRNSAWKTAWKSAGLPSSRQYTRGVHNLKHTFGRRLRAAGVPQETRKVLLSHTNHDITTHYSAAEIQELIDASNSILQSKQNTAYSYEHEHRILCS